MVLVVNVRAVVALVALTLAEELARKYLVRLMITAVLGALSLVAVVVAVAIIALPLDPAIGLLIVLGLIGSSIRHLLRPCCSIRLLGLGRHRKWERRKPCW